MKEKLSDSERARLAAFCRAALLSPVRLAPAYVRGRSWVAVPVESSHHFNEREAEWLQRACALIGAARCIGGSVESGEISLECWTWVPTVEGTMDANHDMFGLNSIVTSPDFDFAILCTVDDYKLVAGPREFVEAAVASSIEIARLMFMRYMAEDPTLDAHVAKNLLDVARIYGS